MQQSLGVSFRMSYSKRSHNWTQPTLQRELGRLVEAEIVYQRGLPPQTTYVFKHALIQDAAYQSLLKSTRQQYHQRIAQVLEAQFPETAETQPELLAHHYTEAGLTEQAVHYWHQAARERSSARRMWKLSRTSSRARALQTLPETPERLQRELDLQIALGASLIATKGYAAPEVEQTYTRARAALSTRWTTPSAFSRPAWTAELLFTSAPSCRQHTRWGNSS